MKVGRRSLLAAAGLWSASAALSDPLRRKVAMPEPMNSIVELRQYTLRGGQRDTLIELFEREFVEPQNALGAHVLGMFRDIDDPDRFVWLRGFREMAAREAALTAFYGGAVWKAHREVANATMIDSDNVLLLRAVAAPLPVGGAGFASHALVTADIYYLADVEPGAFLDFHKTVARSQQDTSGGKPLATFVSETSPNTFPQLPVRERDRVVVLLSGWNSRREQEASALQKTMLSGWRDHAPEAVLPALMRKPERLRLVPIVNDRKRWTWRGVSQREMRDTMVVRAPDSVDEEPWHRLWADYLAFYGAVVSPRVTDDVWGRLCSGTGATFGHVAMLDGRMIGFANCVVHEKTWSIEPTCYLEDLFVTSALRGRGVGRAILDQVMTLGRERGWNSLYWHTATENQTARRLYDRFCAADDVVRYRLQLREVDPSADGHPISARA